MILHGNQYIGDYLDGGSACHINLAEHLSLEQNKSMLKFVDLLLNNHLVSVLNVEKLKELHYMIELLVI